MTNVFRYDCDEKISDCKNNDFNCIDKKHPVPGNSILSTGNGSLGPRTIDFTGGVSTIDINQAIASTTIDTSCNKNLKWLINFNGILNITANNTDMFKFKFTLTSICKNNKVSNTLAIFTFDFLYVLATNQDSRTLNFEYSHCDELCEDCCTYILELTSIQSTNASILNFDINSGLISILGVEYQKSNYFSDIHNKNSGNALLCVNSNIYYSSNLTFTVPNYLITLNQPIAVINLDTTLMKKPKLRLKFTGILNIVTMNIGVTPTLYFTLFKLCKGSRVRTPVTTFAFTNIIANVVSNSETLNFEYSPCDENCFECCTYIIELTSITNGGQPGTMTLSINNGTFSALAFDCCLNRSNKLIGNSIFSSNVGSFYFGPIDIPADRQLTQTLNLPIVSTTIDISNLKCPKFLIDFNGIIHNDSSSTATTTYNFTLYRTCKNSNVLQLLTSFVYNSINLLTLNQSNALKFEYSDNENVCGDCCTYILELTSITASDHIFIYDIGISKAVLSILAVESCN
ncbi:DUF4489 domain-containing protein [Aminipila sp.]|uniref:DUF4489 domain-containing protein n=1 Tax=Aminipila sp. TaxID=2060095 RepID=UPI002898145A|nr:DUF4489 domain-containing protein [Aminipila sp.]